MNKHCQQLHHLTITIIFLLFTFASFAEEENNTSYFKHHIENGHTIQNQWISIKKINSISPNNWYMQMTIEREEQLNHREYTNSWNHIYDPLKTTYPNVNTPIFFRVENNKVMEIQLDNISIRQNNGIVVSKVSSNDSYANYKAKTTLLKQVGKDYSSLMEKLLLAQHTYQQSQNTESIKTWSFKTGLKSSTLELLDSIPHKQIIRFCFPGKMNRDASAQYSLGTAISVKSKVDGKRTFTLNKEEKVYPLQYENDSVLSTPLPLDEWRGLNLFKNEDQKLCQDFVFSGESSRSIVLKPTDTNKHQVPYAFQYDSLEIKIISEFKQAFENHIASPTVKDINTFNKLPQKLVPKSTNIENFQNKRIKIITPYIAKQTSPFWKSYQSFKALDASEVATIKQAYIATQTQYLSQYRNQISLEHYAGFIDRIHTFACFFDIIHNTTPMFLPLWSSYNVQTTQSLGLSVQDLPHISLTRVNQNTMLETQAVLRSFFSANKINENNYPYTKWIPSKEYSYFKSKLPPVERYNYLYMILKTSVETNEIRYSELINDFVQCFPNTPFANDLLNENKGNKYQTIELNYKARVSIAPEFTLPDEIGQHVSLSDFNGTWRVVTFIYASYQSDIDKVKTINSSLQNIDNIPYQHIVVCMDAGSLTKYKSNLKKIGENVIILHDPGSQNETIKTYINRQNYFYLIEPDGVINHRCDLSKIDEEFLEKYLTEQPAPKGEVVSLTSLLQIVGVLIVLFSFAFLIYYRRNAIKRKKENEKRERVELEMSAVRSQLNPHFIFNAMGSIQYLVNKKENQKANLFLANFAKLMRRILNQGDLKLISLAEELDTINTYLSLEALRHYFKYKIIVAPDIDQETIEIPTMIIQPFAENAVLHGVAGMYEEGEIIINIKQTNALTLSITIEDNGKGIQSNPSHKGNGKGISLTQKRCELLQEAYQKHIHFSTREARKIDGNPVGTKVCIDIEMES